MKFMKLGTRADTFYTEESTRYVLTGNCQINATDRDLQISVFLQFKCRTVISDVPSDLTIRVNNTTYLLHKFPLLPKCGLLQILYSDSGNSSNVTLELHDIPGGEDAFELCAKFCYGITINLSAHNFVPAFCAAKFLRMTEAIDKGNFVMKLEAFFSSCILQGWKDSILALQTTVRLSEWSENYGIIRRCIDSIVEKILTPPMKVTWSYTYTRPGYQKRRQQSVPKDWWTEDISDLDIGLFRCILTAARSTNMLLPQLIGEALHVYAHRWLPDMRKVGPPNTSSSDQDQKCQILEAIANMIPSDQGSVSIGFLLKLLSMANSLGVSPATKAELARRSGLQFEEATLNDLLQSADNNCFYDIDLVQVVLESFLRQWRRLSLSKEQQSALKNVGKLIDSYLQVIASDVNIPVQKVASLAQALPDVARPNHDELYKAINIFLKEHSHLTKEDKKQLCRILDCQKLSPEVCAHAVRNERLPLRTVVQVLFFEQERGIRATSHQIPAPHKLNQQLAEDEQFSRSEEPESSSGVHRRLRKTSEKLQIESGPDMSVQAVAESELPKGRNIETEGKFGEKRVDPGKTTQRRTSSEHGHNNKGRER